MFSSSRRGNNFIQHERIRKIVEAFITPFAGLHISIVLPFTANAEKICPVLNVTFVYVEIEKVAKLKVVSGLS